MYPAYYRIYTDSIKTGQLADLKKGMHLELANISLRHEGYTYRVRLE